MNFTPPVLPEPRPADLWHTVDLAVVGEAIAVKVDGSETSSARALEPVVGYVGFQVTRGRVQIRHVAVEALPVANDSFVAGAVRSTDPGVVWPKVLREVRPKYTMDAMEQRVEGDVLLEVIIQPDGSVGRVRIKKPLHPDLDHSAIASAQQWKFTPPLKDAQPVAMLVELSLHFSIFGRRQ